MLTLPQIREALADRNLTKVSEAVGIHRNTLSAIRDGVHVNPTLRTLQALSDYLSALRGAE